MERVDYLIVGAGFAGSVLAERLHSIGKKVLVIEKRDHIGGNSFDYHDEAEVLVHKYGPHYFRTEYEEVKSYLSRFTEWIPHEYIIKASIKERLYSFPINRNTLNQFFGLSLKNEEEAKEFLDSKKEKIADPKNAEEQVLALAGKEIYEAFFKNYTIKQWGIHPTDLDASITARIPIRTNTDERYFGTSFQAMPKEGYHKIFENMLKDIPLKLNTDFNQVKEKIGYKKLIYTGPIDAFFNYRFGKLPYRSLHFIFKTLDKEYFQDYSQVNYPNEHDYTRIVEIKHATHQKCPKTTIVEEYPKDEGEPFYPIPRKQNKELYKQYQKVAEKLKNTYFIGRLAQYKYINMDQTVKSALDLFEKLKDED
ncbi:UDP-galactopyranose mutase [Candidatus Woesearchaeota archaeon]|nr:UDP-galactopyranose mutase [Candidatus Woesearchaeota archaeon]